MHRRENFTRTQEYKSVQEPYRANLKAQLRSLAGYALLDSEQKAKLKQNLDAAAKYTTLRRLVPEWESDDKWPRSFVEFGEKHQIGLAPLTLLHMGVSGISKGITGTDGKTIYNSKGLLIMERAYNLYPEITKWPQARREELFDLLNVGKTIAGKSKEEVSSELAKMR